MKHFLTSILVCLLFLACNNVEETSAPILDIKVNLKINDPTITSQSEIILTAHFYNNTDQDVVMEKYALIENPILALSFFNENGEAIYAIPPSVPKNENNTVSNKILKPKEEHTIKYSLNIFSPELTKGFYAVTMKNGFSNKVFFEIK